MRNERNIGQSIDNIIFEYEMSQDEFNKELISYISFGHVQYQCQFPTKLLTHDIKERLRASYLISESHIVITNTIKRKIFYLCSIPLRQSIVATALFIDNIIDKTLAADRLIIRDNNIKYYCFVSAVDEENLFFVLSQGEDKNTFVCIEVHPSKDIVYAKVLLHKNQLTPTSWQGDYITREEAQESEKEANLDNKIISKHLLH